MFQIRIADTDAGPMDGLYVAEYDPMRSGVAPDGEPLIAHLVVTDDPDQAMQFPSVEAAIEKWRQPYGYRCDGEPNRPLTAFCIEITGSIQ